LSDVLTSGERAALAAISEDLAHQRRARRWRSSAASLAALAVVVAFGTQGQVPGNIDAARALMIGAALTMVAGWLVLSSSTRVTSPPALTHALAALGIAIPLIASSARATAAEPSAMKCAAWIFSFGLALAALLSIFTGRTARRFGGASEWMAAAAATLGGVAVSLRCSGHSFSHLAVHSASALIVVLALLSIRRRRRRR
jgi:hypothetical protein